MNKKINHTMISLSFLITNFMLSKIITLQDNDIIITTYLMILFILFSIAVMDTNPYYDIVFVYVFVIASIVYIILMHINLKYYLLVPMLFLICFIVKIIFKYINLLIINYNKNNNYKLGNY